MSRQAIPALKEEKAPRSLLWYDGAVEDSDPDEPASHFDLLSAASTPLRPCAGKNSLFASSTKRLDNLRLSPTWTRPLWPSHSSSGQLSHPDTFTAPLDTGSVDIFPAASGATKRGNLSDSSSSARSSNIDVRRNSTALDFGVEFSAQSSPGFDIRPGTNPADENSHGDATSADDAKDDGSLLPAELAAQTIVDHSSSEHEPSSEDESSLVFSLTLRPMFLRKRKHSKSPSVLTPQPEKHALAQMSLACDMSDVVYAGSANSTFSILKTSFSASDSTPCPPQPRKRLKFKILSHQHTPSRPSRVGIVLDLSASRKLAASSVPLLTKLNNATCESDSDEPVDSTEAGSSMRSSQLEPSSTPISQSTPANSRPSSPKQYEECPEEVNGFRFVRPATKYQFLTPDSRYMAAPAQKSQQLLNSYNMSDYSGAAKYRIVGNVPVSAAGLMDENNDDVHVGDKRISDPYAVAPQPSPLDDDRFLSAALLERYTASCDKLPVLEHFRRNLTNDEMDMLITDGDSVWRFYRLILLSRITDIHMISFLKRERVRWHPDKWVNCLESSCFVQSNINNLSKVINAFIEDINNGFRDTV
ncbi:hypothetical protein METBISCDRAFT_26316 [Metschnikowia bicuspidata]|uniref:Uncharacterized protein n=1 Tax=Metschnikowia bicuspidata TaxID=27322 RepID=A0A4P9ZGV0_9ASCO|nr:hypothetical protein METBISCDRAFT_26316 [Metschnikowia bicuspidata]